MRSKWFGLVIASALLVAGSASAGTLSYTGTLVLGLGTLPGLVAPGSGDANVNGAGGLGHLSTLGIGSGAFGPVTAAIPVTSNATIQSVRFTAVGNLTGTFTNLSGTAPGGGPMGLSGTSKICIIFPGCAASVTVPFTPTGGGAGIGIGGTVNIAGGGLQLTLQHAPWTIGQPTMTIHDPASAITTPTLPGGYATPASATAGGGGVVQLVTASKVYTSLTGAFPELPVYAVMNITFAPEPGTMMLIPAGVGALVLLGYRRSRK